MILTVMFAFLFISPTSGANAAITIDSVSGVWGPVTGGGGTLNGVGTNEIRWGNSTGFGQSGYRFDGAAPPIFAVDIDVPFTLGEFTHFNNPITGGSISEAQLNTTVDLTIDGNVFSGLSFVYNFLHDETPNSSPCQAGSVSVCDDIVDAQNNSAISDIFNIDGVDYTLEVTGFQVDGMQFDQFMTQEKKTNVADLRGVITKANVEVPEPSTYLMLGGFLMFGLLLKRKQLRAKARN